VNEVDANPASENMCYSYAKRLLVYCITQIGITRATISFNFVLHDYKRKDLPERHKPECEGLLKKPTRTQVPKTTTDR